MYIYKWKEERVEYLYVAAILFSYYHLPDDEHYKQFKNPENKILSRFDKWYRSEAIEKAKQR